MTHTGCNLPAKAHNRPNQGLTKELEIVGDGLEG